MQTVSAQERTWRDDTGQFEVEAELVEFDGQTVKLRKSNGQIISVDVTRFSVADRK